MILTLKSREVKKETKNWQALLFSFVPFIINNTLSVLNNIVRSMLIFVKKNMMILCIFSINFFIILPSF